MVISFQIDIQIALSSSLFKEIVLLAFIFVCLPEMAQNKLTINLDYNSSYEQNIGSPVAKGTSLYSSK